MWKERTGDFAVLTQRYRTKLASDPAATASRNSFARIDAHASASSAQLNNGGQPKLQFTIVAGSIGKQIHDTSTKLANLTKLARSTSLFDDKSEEINQLTQIIKKDINTLNHQIEALQNHANTQRQLRKNKQTESHTTTIVSSLKSKLAQTTKMFQSVLETRTQNLKVQQEKRNKFGGPGPSLNRPDVFKPRPITFTSNGHEGGGGGDEVAIQIGGMQQQKQQSLLGMQDSYIASRTTAVESIEQTIVELQGIFTQLARLVSEQGEAMERIDANVENALGNVEGAQTQLLKYMQSISGNRALAIKMFLVLIVFIVVFVVFFL